MTDKKEQGFNDAELQDIMSEIENLEREYEEDEQPEATEAVLDPIAAEMQAHENEQVDTQEDEIFAEVEAHVEVETQQKNNVVNITPKEIVKTEGGHHVEFHGAGQVNFSLNFDIAGQTAHLEVSDQGLVVSLDGMNLTVDETNGCTVEMEGGVKFSVPMGGQSKAKKAA